MIAFLKRQPPVRIIAMGFALVILLGSGLLMLPCSLRDGATLHYIDALYTSTSAVCVTGLIAADAGDTFSLFGRTGRDRHWCRRYPAHGAQNESARAQPRAGGKQS